MDIIKRHAIVNSKGNMVKIFCETIEDEAIAQIQKMADYPAYQDSQIRIMPDAHAGKGCTIGTTMTLTDKVTPNLVGVDIGCGMLAIELSDKEIDFAKLDEVIRTYVPSGFNVHSVEDYFDFSNLRCADYVDLNRAKCSIGTLGGGNHFIEVDKSEQTGNYWLVIHTGSRKLGCDVCKHYQDKAIKNQKSRAKQINEIVERLKAEGRDSEIQDAIKALPMANCDKELAHLSGQDFEDYVNDMEIVQAFASGNRCQIGDIIVAMAGLHPISRFTTIHNYIDTDSMILRKGAVSAKKGEKLLIPMNMRDGSLICVGKGNPDWNYSAPHGAGRLMSRKKAKESLSMEDYKGSMEGIYTTSVNSATIDEAPMAYKPMEEIVRQIKGTAEIVDIIKPVYNFKAAE